MKNNTISIAIQKGGSGKTTTAINLAAFLRNQGKKVLLVDLDPQANLTQAVGLLEEQEPSIYHAFHELSRGNEAPLGEYLIRHKEVDVIPSSLDLAMAEMELVSIFGREQLLKQFLAQAKTAYDIIIIDCPPAMGMLTINALTASQGVIIPLQAEFLPMKGLQNFMKSVNQIKKQLNPELTVLGYLMTRFDPRKNLNRKISDQLREEFGDMMFSTHIRTNIALAQAQDSGLDIFRHAASSHGAEDYQALGEELLKRIKS